MPQRPDSFRYHPPAFEVEPSLAWTLSRALGPLPERCLGPALEPETAEQTLEWARALGLLERIADRVPREMLRRELPEAAVEDLLRRRDELAARTLLLQELLDIVAHRAAALDIPVIALKGMALLEAGYVQYGRRCLVDLDLLTPAERAHELATALAKDGLEPVGAGERHHLPPLGHPRLGAVELHLHVPGLSVEGGRPATADLLLELGAVQPCARLGALSIPKRELLVAHAVAHGLDQHGWSPTAYPLTRLVADLIDMADPASGNFVPESARSWIGQAVSRREMTALAHLCRALEAGDLDQLDSDADRLLCHSLVAIAHPDYRRRLRRRAALRALRRGQWSKLRNGLAHAAAVSDE